MRDKYTSLAFLAGSIALDRMNQPSSAVPMFDRYARAGKSLQVQTKGNYWAGRAAQAAEAARDRQHLYQQAAAYPELFYASLRSSASAERCRRHTVLPSMSRRCSSALHSTAAHWSRRSGYSASRTARLSKPCS